VSGFAGIVRLELAPHTAEIDRAAIGCMAQAIAFRGPDAQQQFTQDGASFAFSLLTTGPAPQVSAQPVSLDGETFLLGDVRLDGRDEVIRKLGQQGIAVQLSATEEELVLHFVLRFGAQALHELDGDFSFVLWNSRKRKLTAFRDLTGARPFFYHCGNGKLSFSNTLQAILADSSISWREYDLQFIADSLLGAPHHDPERTVYREARRLPAGSLLEFSAGGLSVRRIANLPIEELLVCRDSEIIEEFRRLFAQAVADRLPHTDAAILLSGGLDSTSIAAEVAALRRSSSADGAAKLHGLCVDFQPLYDDEEGVYASRCARALGMPLEVVHSGESLPFADWQHSFRELPEPLGDPYCSLYLSYRKRISQKARVVLSGDGGDELLRLQAAPYLRFLRRTRGVWNAGTELLRRLVSSGRLPPLGFGIRSGVRRRLGRASPEERFPAWFSPDFEFDHRLRERWGQMGAPPTTPHPFNPKAYNAMNSGLFAEVQEICDSTWTLVPLQTRNPFLDRRLCRFLLRVPLIPWALNKHLLRTAQTGILPEEIRLRPKTPVRRDPLLLHAKAGSWDREMTEVPADLLRPLIDWPLLSKLIGNASDTSLYVHLRPVALSRWLKAVEMPARIQ